jgi:DNA-binding HxlR family transcriptional regulator
MSPTRSDAGPGPCPAREIFDRIGERWSVHILVALDETPTHYSGLLRRVDGISRRMLTRNLRDLERDGLITRTVRQTSPVTVEYALTAPARELAGPLLGLVSWAQRNGDQVRQARERYDDRSRGVNVGASR